MEVLRRQGRLGRQTADELRLPGALGHGHANRIAARLDTQEGGARMRPALVHPGMRSGARIFPFRIGLALSVDGVDNVQQTRVGVGCGLAFLRKLS
jgi:hypothetical protein